MPASRCAGLTIAFTVAALAAIACTAPPAHAHPAAALTTIPTTEQLDAEFSTIKGDTAASAKLPDGKVLVVYADTLAAGSKVFCTPTACPYGYPHNGFALQASPGSLALTPVFKSSLPYDFQEIPNGSDGSILWPTGVVATSSAVYIYCARVIITGTGVFSFTVTGSAVAVFSVSLAYQKTVSLPLEAGVIDLWTSAVSASGGWWLAGSDGSTVKEGDVAWVPSGDLATPSKWTVHQGVIPAADQPGTSVAIAHIGAGWQAWTKQGDALGPAIEELTASSPLGPWTVAAAVPAPSPAGTFTYGVELHPEEPHPSGQILLSYSVNGTGAYADYHPLFEYVP